MKIIGISAFYHDSAAALIEDGNIVCAAQEERFTRVKHDSSFPENALKFCVSKSGVALSDIDHVVFFEKPFIKFERLLETYLALAPRGFRSFSSAMPVWLKEKLFQKNNIRKALQKIDPEFSEKKILFSEHHLSHAASAFFPSPFKEAAILTLDGVGEWCTTSVAHGSGNHISILKEIHFPHSLGLLYSAFTYYTGFKVNSGEYKLMGLAPYGDPKFVKTIYDHLIDVKEDGSFRLDLSYFDYCTGLRMVNKKFEALFGRAARSSETPIEQFHMDIAASIQKVTEDIVIKLARHIAQETKANSLCLAGGVALNCVANGKLLREGLFENIWIQPAAGDAGGSLGAALVAYYMYHNKKRHISLNGSDAMHGSYIGPDFSEEDIESGLTKSGAIFTKYTSQETIEKVSNFLEEGKVVGWMQGKMEFGPRALGGRSIIADPRSEIMQKNLNLKIKYRESFRPFAPSILREDLKEWFDLDQDSPYMLLVTNVLDKHCYKMTENQKQLFGIEKLNVKRSSIPAVTHVDYSARIQTVHKETNPTYHSLLTRFKERTGCPILVNTSFNVRGEPIVCTPEDAFRCFMGTEMDILVIDNFILSKADQDPKLKKNYKNEFQLD